MNSPELSDITTRLQRLRQRTQILITQLTGQPKADFDACVRYIRLLQGSPQYSQFIVTVKRIFSDVSNVKPGTVGAYFTGCFLDTNFNPHECSAICAGSLQESEQVCTERVYSATHESGQFKFQQLNDSKSDRAYIFGATQLTSSEKADLQHKGVKEVSLSHYSDGGKKYKPNTAHFIPLSKVPAPPNTPNICVLTPVENNDNSTFWVIVLSVVIIIVIAGLAFAIK